jgi:hypothetical protein
MESEIQNIRLKFNCDADWNSMATADGGRHCNSCNKKVYDFTDAKQYEFLQILAENNHNICGRFRLDQMAPKPIYVPVWKKWVSAALVLLGLNILNDKVVAQGKPIAPKSFGHIKQVKFPPPVIVGDVATLKYDRLPEFPGGEKALQSFLLKNLHFTKGMINGNVFANFHITANGSLSNIEIVRKLSKANDAEVIRVLKMSPKWKPAILKGKAVAYPAYTIPVNFSH